GCRQQAEQGQYRPREQDRSVERCGGKEPGIGEGQARLARAHGLAPVISGQTGACLAHIFQRPASSSLPRCTAARTCAGAVPPTWSRAFTEPSRVSTANTSSVICSLNWRSSSRLISARSLPVSTPYFTAW